MPEITTKRGITSLIDDVDSDLASVRWCQSAKGYFVRGYRKDNGNQGLQLLHRVILSRMLNRELVNGEQVDHINGNPLDNRRSNLRLANHSENRRNSGLARNNTTNYKGVSYISRTRRYWAHIGHDKKRYDLGLFDTAIEAARAYDAAAIRLHGEFARLNFPQNIAEFQTSMELL